MEIKEGGGQFINYDLITIDTSEPPVVISRLSPGEGGQFTYSRDGSRIAFTTPVKVFVTDALGGERLELHTFTPVNTETEDFYFPPLSWTRDGSAVRVIIPPPNPKADSSALTTLYHMRLDNSPYITVGLSTVPVFESEAVLSPDANKVAYISPADKENEFALRIWETGGEDFLYDEGNVGFLAWSMDNLNFLYTRDGDPYLGQYGNMPQLLQGIREMYKVQFVDSSRYLYLQENGDLWELWLGALDGSRFLIAESAAVIDYDFVR